jgi:nucleoside-diphosphate-sugar epimerase
MNNKILILGGCGYIGSALYIYLKNKGFDVTSIDLGWFGEPILNTKLDYDQLKKYYLDTFDVVVLLASHSSVPMCKVDRLGTLENNVRKFLTLTSKLSHQKFIYASSSCVYDSFTDEATEDRVILPPKDDLAMSKYIIDAYAPNLINNIYPEDNFLYYGLRFGSVAGPSPNFRTDLMVNAMSLSAKQNGYVNVSNREAYRPILAMEDLCTAIEAIITTNPIASPGIYNLCSFNSSIGDIASSIAKFHGVETKFTGDTKTFSFTMSENKFSEVYNWKPKHDLNSLTISIDEFLNKKNPQPNLRLIPGNYYEAR